jgi:hypothetical protein
MFPVLSANGPSGYNLTNSLRFRSSASAYLTRTPSSGTGLKFTFSAWIKRGSLGATYATLIGADATGGFSNLFAFANDTLALVQGATTFAQTTAVYRDPSAWYHIMLVWDSANATASNRCKFYVNGVEPTYSTNSVTLNTAIAIGFSSRIQAIAADYATSAGYRNFFDGYMAEVNFVDGAALTPSSFGSTNATTGVWQPTKYTGTYGTNGFYLNFNSIALTSGSNTGLGKDNSGNGNYWNTNNISVTAGTTYDAMTDVPTLTSATVANYPVWNPLKVFTGNLTLSNANLTASDSSTSIVTRIATMSTSTSGKYYFEVTATAISASNGFVGVADSTYANANAAFQLVGSYRSGGQIYNLAGTAQTAGNTYTSGDIVGVAVDIGAGTVQFYKNNVAQGSTPSFTFTAGTELWSFVATDNNAGTKTFDVNFGQRTFSYTPSTGFVALNTYNLPTSTIVKGNTVMDATLYTGTGASLSVTNAGAFKPDLVWMKGRSGATDHALYDSVRGTTKDLVSNSTAAETTQATGLTAFGTSGFTVGALAKLNTSTATYVGWQWQAGQGSSSSNTSGTITSTVSVNTTAGFSVVTYTGTGANATVGHGLGVAPKMVIVKTKTNVVGDWMIWHTNLTSGAFYLKLNTSAAQASAASVWNSTVPTSSVFSVGTDQSTNFNSSTTYVAYCWAEIAGFSKFGSYTGNGSTDGPFVYTGFRPKFIMIKSSSAVEQWDINDTSRDIYNVAQYWLAPNLSNAEGTVNPTMDILSNGFKIRMTGAPWNTSSATYIYMAFAENPFKNALAR